MTMTLNPTIAAACRNGWYTPKSRREIGEVFRLGGHPVAVLAVEDVRELVGAPDDEDADGTHTVRRLRLRDATAAEMAVAEASRAAYRAGHDATHPDRRANAEQMARIAAELEG